MLRYQCYSCHLIISGDDVLEGKCPVCKDNHLEKMCEADHVCHCAKQVSEGIHYCSLCKKPICKCGSHDVATISRVTGYLQAVEGWNAAKKQELIDRQRYNVV